MPHENLKTYLMLRCYCGLTAAITSADKAMMDLANKLFL